MDYDASFESSRLIQLTEQLLSGTSISGDILFYADKEDCSISGATWRFEDEDHAKLKESGFKYMLMELLDTLIQYRARHQFTETLDGLVHLENSSADIQWLLAEEVESRRLTD